MWLDFLYLASSAKKLALNGTAFEQKIARRNRRYLQMGLGLEVDPDVPLIACITRLVPQKVSFPPASYQASQLLLSVRYRCVMSKWYQWTRFWAGCPELLYCNVVLDAGAYPDV